MENLKPVSSPETSQALVKSEDWRSKKWESREILEEGLRVQILLREDFSAIKEIHKRKGPAIEVAGPTDGFFFHEFNKSGGVKKIDLFKERPVFISNIYPGKPEFDGSAGGFLHFRGPVHFVADARKLPIVEESVELLFCSCLGQIAPSGVKGILSSDAGHAVPKQETERIKERREPLEEVRVLREQAIVEAFRVLKSGGLLIWFGGKTEDINFALGHGFIIVQREKINWGETDNYNVIFMKDTRKEK